MLKMGNTTELCECLHAVGKKSKQTLQDNVNIVGSDLNIREIACCSYLHFIWNLSSANMWKTSTPVFKQTDCKHTSRLTGLPSLEHWLPAFAVTPLHLRFTEQSQIISHISRVLTDSLTFQWWTYTLSAWLLVFVDHRIFLVSSSVPSDWQTEKQTDRQTATWPAFVLSQTKVSYTVANMGALSLTSSRWMKTETWLLWRELSADQTQKISLTLFIKQPLAHCGTYKAPQ